MIFRQGAYKDRVQTEAGDTREGATVPQERGVTVTSGAAGRRILRRAFIIFADVAK